MRPAVRLLCCAVLVGSVGLTGCGVRDDHTAGAQEGQGEGSLPTLPPVEERLPASYDEQGCLIVAEDEVDCEASADALDEALSGGGAGGVRTLAGFVGPRFTTDLSGDALVVLEDTVATSTDGVWSARGLIRNETTSPAVAPVVSAVLRAADGTELERVEAPVTVRPVRPGEPAPFTVSASTTAPGQVASVDWSVHDAGGDPPPGTRDLELTTWDVEPAGPRDPITVYDHVEEGAGPHPYVLFGAVTDRAGIAAPRPGVTAAWLGDDGRVRLVADTAALDPHGAELAALEPEGLADFLITVDPADAAGLDADQLLLWAVSR